MGVDNQPYVTEAIKGVLGEDYNYDSTVSAHILLPSSPPPPPLPPLLHILHPPIPPDPNASLFFFWVWVWVLTPRPRLAPRSAPFRSRALLRPCPCPCPSVRPRLSVCLSCARATGFTRAPTARRSSVSLCLCLRLCLCLCLCLSPLLPTLTPASIPPTPTHAPTPRQNTFRALYRSFRECCFIEDDGDIVFYKNQHGEAQRFLAGEKRPTTDAADAAGAKEGAKEGKAE